MTGPERRRRVIEALASAVLLVTLLVVALPEVTGSSWEQTAEVLDDLGGTDMALLFAVWIVNLLAYTFVLTTSLPGLGHGQALTLNLAGSAVSNTVPFGGAVGVGATYGICGSWGFTPAATTLSILVTGIWNVFAKLGLPVVALGALLVMGETATGQRLAAGIGFFVLAALLVVMVLVLESDAAAHRIAGGADRALAWVYRRLRRDAPPDVHHRVVELRDTTAELVRRRWKRLTVWMVAYNVLQFSLLMLALRLLGGAHTGLGWAEVFASFAFARLLGVIPLTPSGAGFVEVGLAGALASFGAPPALAGAAAVTFSVTTFWLEIPMGLVGWLVWATRRRWRAAMPATVSPPPAG